MIQTFDEMIALPADRRLESKTANPAASWRSDLDILPPAEPCIQWATLKSELKCGIVKVTQHSTIHQKINP